VATLHVRNVPDPLYELLRRAAEREGRSIGSQATFYLQAALIREGTMESLRVPRDVRPAQRFAEAAKAAVVAAQNEARALNHKAVGTEHLLVVLVEHFKHLQFLRLTAERVRSYLAAEEGRSPGRIPFDDDAKRALELALRESLAHRSQWIDASHLLVAIAMVRDSRGAEILRELGVDEGALRSAVVLSGPPSASLQRLDAPNYLAVDLDGSAERWTERLNDLAAEGWELMQVVERRAILRRC
jgi:ATP-dependent Clp protease ATP-binding subunit ClpA/plasmid stability protein